MEQEQVSVYSALEEEEETGAGRRKRSTTVSSSGRVVHFAPDQHSFRRRSTISVPKMTTSTMELSEMSGLSEMWRGNLAGAIGQFEQVGDEDRPIRASRIAQAWFIRAFFSPSLEEHKASVLGAVSEACKALEQESKVLLLELFAPPPPSKEGGMVRRLSMRALRSVEEKYALRSSNPGELRADELEEGKRDSLYRWKMLQGHLALVTVLSAWVYTKSDEPLAATSRIMRAIDLVLAAQKNSEAHADHPSALGLVAGTFELWKARLPAWMERKREEEGAERGTRILEAIVRNSDPRGEINHYARLALAGHLIFHEGEPFCAMAHEKLNRARDILNGGLDAPNWVLFRWMRFQLSLRQRQLADALDDVRFLRKKLQVEENQLFMDEIGLLFALARWTELDEQLARHQEEIPEGVLRALSFCSYQAQSGTGDLKSKAPLANPSSPWARKALLFETRRNKLLPYMEMMYLMGYLCWCNAGRLSGFKSLLQGMLDRENERDEEFLTIEFLLAVVSAKLSGDPLGLIGVVDRPSLQLPGDAWQVPCALYEQAVLRLLKHDFAQARLHLQQAKKLGEKILFAPRLLASISAALEYAAEVQREQQAATVRDEGRRKSSFAGEQQQGGQQQGERAIRIPAGRGHKESIELKSARVAWSWSSTTNVLFSVEFTPLAGEREDEKEKMKLVTAGRLEQGDFVSLKGGILSLCWLNNEAAATARITLSVVNE